MTDDPKKPIAPQVPSDDERPEIYGIKKGENGIVFNRRSFLGAFAAAGALASCGPTSSSQGKDASNASTPSCGHSEAHAGEIDGLSMQGELLFSWGFSGLKAWEFTKGQTSAKG